MKIKKIRGEGGQIQEEEQEIVDEDPNSIFNTEDRLFYASDIMVGFDFDFIHIFLIFLVILFIGWIGWF